MKRLQLSTLTVVDLHVIPCVQIESLRMVAIVIYYSMCSGDDKPSPSPFSGLFSDLIERFILASNGMRFRRKYALLLRVLAGKRRDVAYGQCPCDKRFDV